MIRSGAADQPERATQPFRIIHSLLFAFRDRALRLVLPLHAWRRRLRVWWGDMAAELTDDPRPGKTKQVRKSKSKSKGKSARAFAPHKPF